MNPEHEGLMQTVLDIHCDLTLENGSLKKKIPVPFNLYIIENCRWSEHNTRISEMGVLIRPTRIWCFPIELNHEYSCVLS